VAVEVTGPIRVVTTSQPHGFLIGQPVKVTTGPYTGTGVVTRVTSDKVFSFCGSTSTGPASTAITDPNATVEAISGFTSQTLDFDPGFSTTYTDTSTDGTQLLIYVDPPMSRLIAATEYFLASRQLAGSTLYAEPVVWLDIDVALQVHVRDLYNRAAVQAAVQAAVAKVLSYDSVDFGLKISIGDIYRAALNVGGVEYVTLTSLHVTGDPDAVVDIDTPDAVLPRLNPALVDTEWTTAVGGLVNT
jgi:hypothetical protein